MDANQYLSETIEEFERLKKLAEKALTQADPQSWYVLLDEQSNSIAIIMKHLAGNMRSRWTDFLTSDGEKPDRRRDSEFVIEDGDTGEKILEIWNAGWRCLFDALRQLRPEDFDKTVIIRGEPHSIVKAINRQLSHYACHVGQIVFLARHFAAGGWKSLSIPRGKSEEFNAALRKKQGQL